ncbi:paramyosin-like isoform X3 [Argopecten irradians]|uniref:paramyosin-like isoform X3 n=1 Tax=Argopecten irradians TaxID=31199 RepID=UPI003714B967
MYRPWYIAKWQNLIPLIVLLSAIYGSEAALTDAIFHGKTEVLVTPGLVRKEGLTLDTCASACVAEKTIKCQFFKFINSTKTCYLSETDHPKIKHVGINTPVGSSSSGNGKSSKGSKFDDLQKSIDRLKNVQKKVENLVETDDEKSSSLKDLQRQSVKQVKAIVTLDGRLRSLHSQVSDIRGDLSDLQKSQTTIARNLQSVRSSTGNLGSNVKRLAHLAGELNSNVEDVKLFNSSILRQLARVSHSTSNLDKKLNRLSSYLHDKKIFNPDNMQQSQFRIAKGMAVLAQSQKTFWHQLHGLEHTVSMLTATLGRESRGHGHTQSALLNLQTSVHNIKLALAKLSDPMSIQNRQWQGDVNSIKHVLSTLAGTNSRLDGEMKSNRREVASVIKDLANVQMAVQSLKSNVAGIQSTNSDLLESVQDLLKTKTKIPSIVQMTKISTTILKSLSAIDRKERILTSRMKQFGDSLYSIEKKMQTKNTANRLQKHALIQLTRRVKDLSRDMQRINKLVMNINKKTPSTKGAQQIEVVQRKLVLAISQLQTRLSGIEVQMKRGQSAIEKNSVKTAANLVTKSTNLLKTSIKALKSDMKELKKKSKDRERKLDKLHEEMSEAVKGKLKPKVKCPMGTSRKGNKCIGLKPSIWKKGRPGRRKPGQKRPGRRRPGQRKPGKRRPGKRRPGKRKPGRRRPGRKRPDEGSQEGGGLEGGGPDKGGQEGIGLEGSKEREGLEGGQEGRGLEGREEGGGLEGGGPEKGGKEGRDQVGGQERRGLDKGGQERGGLEKGGLDKGGKEGGGQEGGGQVGGGMDRGGQEGGGLEGGGPDKGGKKGRDQVGGQERGGLDEGGQEGGGKVGGGQVGGGLERGGQERGGQERGSLDE